MRASWIIAAAIAATAAGGAAVFGAAGRSAEIEIAERARSIIAAKLEPRRAHSRARLLALYRASSITRSIFEPEARWRRLRARADLIRVVRRDLFELGALERELAWVQAAGSELGHQPEASPRPALLNPVAGAPVVSEFGTYEPAPGVTSVRRGIELGVARGAEVLSPAAGVLVYAGPVANLGETAVIESSGHWIVVGPVALARPQGARVGRGEVIARTRSDRLYLELRRVDSRGGVPQDPTPLADPASR